MLKLTAPDLPYTIAGRGKVYPVLCPPEWAGIDRGKSVGIIGAEVEIDGVRGVVRGVERVMPMTPYRKGECIGLLLETEPSD